MAPKPVYSGEDWGPAEFESADHSHPHRPDQARCQRCCSTPGSKPLVLVIIPDCDVAAEAVILVIVEQKAVLVLVIQIGFFV